MVEFEVFFPFQGKIRIRVRIQIFGSLDVWRFESLKKRFFDISISSFEVKTQILFYV